MYTRFHGDTLSHRGREFALVDQPLEAYFELIGRRPAFDCAEGRGYAAHWVIEDGWLYLAALSGHWAGAQPLSLRHLFPFADSKVFAAWLTGNLRGYRSDRPLPATGSPSNMPYPDIVLRIETGRLDAASIVHREFPAARRALAPDMVAVGAAAGAHHAAWNEAFV